MPEASHAEPMPRWGKMCLVSFLLIDVIIRFVTMLKSQSENVKNASDALSISHLPPVDHSNDMIRIFYNLFIKDAEDSSRVLGIVDEQLSHIDPDLHDKDVFITSIGYHQPSNISHVNTMQHYPEGGEDISLHSLWEYCQDESNNRAKVVYLHSKGSFHPNENNNKLRRFLSEGALSRECAGLPNECDVCSSRMSPHPHPHTSGNMWLARCSYIAKLRDPYALRDGDLPSGFNHDNGCKGFGRYFFEHWVHSHPTVRPCDLYTGKEYTFAHENLPGGNFTKDLQKAPRFGFDVFSSLLLKHSYYCREDTSSLVTARDYLENRKWNYEQLYNITMLDESWYLWPFLNDSSPNLIHTS